MWACKVSAWVVADPFYFDKIHRHRTVATWFLLVVSYIYIYIYISRRE